MASLEDALSANYPAGTVKRYSKDDKATLIADLQADLTADDAVLLKGSHGIHLEEVVTALV